MITRANFLNSLLLLVTFALTACGGGGGGGAPAVSQGNFIDSAVEGLTYTSGEETGETDINGLFSYETGKTVTFSVGDIEIGTVNGSKTITPVQLVDGAFNEINIVVLNIVQFLLSIDADHNSANGIQITQAIRDAAVGLSVDFTDVNFNTSADVALVVNALTTASGGNMPLISDSVASSHLRSSLYSLLAGSYSGTFSGGDAGSWNISISDTGSLSGTGTANSGGSIIISGMIDTSGLFGGSGWTGNIDVATGLVTGTWTVTVQNTTLSGTYSGSKN